MTWNWQQTDWPRFSWREDRLRQAEEQFLVRGGVILGAMSHLGHDAREHLSVEAMSEEAVSSSEIEGELLNRDSVLSSIRRALGLRADTRRASPAERGIAEMMVDLHRTSSQPLSNEQLWGWHERLMQGRRDIEEVGRYRTHDDPMQVVSGRFFEPTIHFEAPPSTRVPAEMDAFLAWYNASAPGGADPLPALTRAGVAHLHFESIHPFEDGNGRIGRAISEKALAQGLGGQALTALAATILVHRRGYYEMLEASNQHNDIENWLAWFAGIALEAQARTRARVDFLIDKAKLMASLRDRLNARQEKVLLRVLAEGPEGFRGGLSASNYQRIAGTSPATAGRDLADLVRKGALTRTGARRHARYHLTIPLRPVSPVTIDEAGGIVAGAEIGRAEKEP